MGSCVGVDSGWLFVKVVVVVCYDGDEVMICCMVVVVCDDVGDFDCVGWW